MTVRDRIRPNILCAIFILGVVACLSILCLEPEQAEKICSGVAIGMIALSKDIVAAETK